MRFIFLKTSILSLRKLLAVLSFFVALIQSSNAQLYFPVVGVYKNKSAQGMAIHGHYAYLFSDGGYCRLLNLQDGKVENEFYLSSSSPTNHVNNACFGIEKGTYNNIPYLYITECKNKYRCFVEEVLEDTTRLVQTISATNRGKMDNVLIWTIDRERKLLYSVTRTDKTLKSEGYSLNTITEYRLPLIADGTEVVLTEKDIISQYIIHFPNILQGAKIRGGKMYIATGLLQGLSDRLDSSRAIQVIDLKKKKLKKSIDLTYVTTNEPEDIDFYQGKTLLYCGQQGGIYKIKVK